MMHTKDRLAAALREAGAKASRVEAPAYEALAARAETGEFDDYLSPHVCGLTVLRDELRKAWFFRFAARVESGEFDGTFEESEAWANSPEGREAFELLIGPR